MLATACILFANTTTAQVKVGNNPTVINGNAVLDIESTNKGVLLPRLALTATSNASPLSAHVAGMFVYNTATVNDVTPGIYYNNGTQWQFMKSVNDEPWRNVGTGTGATASSTDIYYNGGSIAIGQATTIGGARLTISGIDDNTPQIVVRSPAAGINGNFGIIYRAMGAGGVWLGYLGNNTNIPLPGAAIIAGGGKNIYFMTGNTNGSAAGNAADPSDPVNLPRMTILDNSGNVGIGTTAPVGPLHIASSIDAGSNSPADAASLVIGDYNATHMEFDNNELAAMINSTTEGQLTINGNGGDVHISNVLFTEYTTNRVGINTASPTATLSVNGAANKTGGGAWTVFSDSRSKDHVFDYTKGLKELLQVHPVSFQYKKEMNWGTDPFVGVIAQELETILPSMVKGIKMGNLDDFRQVDPNEFTYLLINSVKELNGMMEKQQKEIEILKEEISRTKTLLEQKNKQPMSN